jgi:Spy/CpxP family protein refolding chaperone
MKHSFCLYLAAAALLAAPAAFAQTAPASTATTAPATADSQKLDIVTQDGKKYLLISSIHGIQGNYEFQQNVQIVQNQRQQIVDLTRRRESAFTTPEKEAITQRLLVETKSLDENNKKMFSAYGFTLTQQYWLQVHKSRVYSPISDEDFNKLSDADKKKPDFIISRPSRDKDEKVTTIRLKQVVEVDGILKNDALRNDAQQVQSLRQRAAQLDQIQTQVKTDEDKKKVAEAVKKTEEELQKKNQETQKAYGFDLTSAWALEVEDSQLRIPVTDEQLEAIKKRQAEEAAKGTTPPTAS